MLINESPDMHVCSLPRPFSLSYYYQGHFSANSDQCSFTALRISCALVTSACEILMTLHPTSLSQVKPNYVHWGRWRCILGVWGTGTSLFCNIFQQMILLLKTFLYGCILWQLLEADQLLTTLCTFLRYESLFTLENVWVDRNKCCFGTLLVYTF